MGSLPLACSGVAPAVTAKECFSHPADSNSEPLEAGLRGWVTGSFLNSLPPGSLRPLHCAVCQVQHLECKMGPNGCRAGRGRWSCLTLAGSQACQGRDDLGGCWKAAQAVARVRSTLHWLELVLEEVAKCSWWGSMVHMLGPGLVLKVGYADQEFL